MSNSAEKPKALHKNGLKVVHDYNSLREHILLIMMACDKYESILHSKKAIVFVVIISFDMQKYTVRCYARERFDEQFLFTEQYIT